MGEKSAAFKSWFANRKNWNKVVLPLAIILAIFVAGQFIDIHRYLQVVQGWIWGLGIWGPVIYGAIYVGAMLMMLPGTPFTITAALLFGTLWGFVTMLLATTLAAVIAFLMARYAARAHIEERFQDQEHFQKAKRWVEKNQWLAIPFVRIMPFFPFAMNNYALGLTRIGFGSFLFFSEVVFAPMTAALVFAASALYEATVRGEISWWLILGSMGAGVVVLGFGLAGKKVFEETTEE
jgi:uncharacterized membrane protein YdjX (TVP38/TMEM64 family)